MKRPPSIIAAIVVFSLFFVINLFSVVSGFKSSPAFTVYLVASLMPLSHALALFAIFFRKPWGRIYCVVLLTVWALGLSVVAILSSVQQKNPITAIFGVLPGAFLLWLVYALFKGIPAKEYFSSTKAAETTQPSQ